MPEIQLTHDEVVSFGMLQEALAETRRKVEALKDQADALQNAHNAKVHAYYHGLAERRAVAVEGPPAKVTHNGETILLTWPDPEA